MEEDNILLLNEYCFLEIFKHLSLGDLANFKEVYRSVGAVADREFSSRTDGSLYFNKNKGINDIQIIKQFGSSIDHLAFFYDMSDYNNWNEIFSALNLHFKGNLKSLSLLGESAETITEDDVLLIVRILRNIEMLKVGNYGKSCVFPFMLSHCENVKDLKLNFKIDKNHQQTIFQKNKNLLQLEMNMRIKDIDLKTIVDNLMNTRLKYLRIKIWRTTTLDGNIHLLNQLPYLKRLSIHCMDVNANSFLWNGFQPGFQSLKVLCLSWVHLDEAGVVALGTMSRLKVLSLNFCFFRSSHINDFYFESLLFLCGNRSIEHLKYLLRSSFFAGIDEVNFLKLIKKRKDRAAEKCLHLTLEYDIYRKTLLKIPSALLEANQCTIKVIDSNDQNYKYYDLP